MTRNLSDHPCFSSISLEEAHIRYEGRILLNAATAYANIPDQPGSGRLLQTVNMFGKSDSGEGVLYRTSDNNGETWSEQYIMDRSYQAAHARNMMRKIAADIIYDVEAKVMVRFGTEMLWENDSLPSILKKRRMYYMLSFDNGHSWTDAIYIHQDGDGYDRDRQFPGVTFGVNMMCIIMKVHQIQGSGPNQGKLAVGVQIQKIDDQGELINPTGMGFFKSGCLLGTWNSDALKYEWEISETLAEVSLEESTRGVYEPVIQELPDGRLLMVLRGSNAGRSEEIIGTKWISFSEDQGRSWSRPVRWTYADGSTMYSSACCPDLVKDRKGNLYFVGVINEDNPNGNLPRYPLCIAKVDPVTLGVERETVAKLDTIRDEHRRQIDEDQAKYPIDYSNHYSYLDQTGEKIIVHAPFRPDLTQPWAVINKYKVELNIQ